MKLAGGFGGGMRVRFASSLFSYGTWVKIRQDTASGASKINVTNHIEFMKEYVKRKGTMLLAARL